MDDKIIFVQIASYRDEELLHTIESCISNASYPDRLRFGIFHQYDDLTKQLLDVYIDNPLFKIENIDWRESRGVGYARYRCNRLYSNEDFTLQIDSHMRFDPGWDKELLLEWLSCGDDYAILSTYPSPFRYDKGTETHLPYGPTMLVVNKFFNGFVPTFKGMPVKMRADGKLRKSLFVAGGFIFAPGIICKEVPYVQDVCFMGEEIVYSVRLFTHGYNFYIPNRLGVYHLYDRPKSSRFWNDMPQADEELVKNRHQVMMQKNDQFLRNFFVEGSEKPLGRERSFEEFENYSGVYFEEKLVSPKQVELREPPYAYSGEWVNRFFERKNVHLSIDLSTTMYPKSDPYIMWRFKLTSGISELYSIDIPYDQLRKNNFVVTVDAKLRKQPTHYRVRPYLEGEVWYDPIELEIDGNCIKG